MIIDLHVHTKPLSPDSEMTVHDAIDRAKRIGLDGICLTEHDKIWPEGEIKVLRDKYEFLVLRGIEVTTFDGHVLVFGFHKDVGEIPKAKELCQLVKTEGGFMVAAHPFRGFLVFGFSGSSITIEQASTRPIFKWVDALEVGSCKVTSDEDKIATRVSKRLNLPVTGGSDAHSIGDLGRAVTVFERQIRDEADLVRELLAGRFLARHFRK